MKFIINNYYSAEDVSKHINHHNHQFGIRSTPQNRRVPGKKYEVYVTVMFGGEKYENVLMGNELKYHMQDGKNKDGSRKNPSKVNFEIKENGGAHIFLQVNKGKYKYIGLCKLNKFDLENRYMYFDVNPKSFVESLLFVNKTAVSNLRKTVKHIIGVPSDNSEVIYDYMSDTPLPLEYEEGNISHAIVKIRKRNNELRKEAVLERGKKCELCKENLADKYGEDNAVVHVHHIKPLSTFSESHKTSLKDVLVLCPTCHSVFHKNPRKAKSLSEMKKIISTDDDYTFE